MGKDLLLEAFHSGVKADPSYWPLYAEMANCLLPRWYGEPGDLADFLNQIEQDADGDDKLALYAYVVGTLKNVHSSAMEFALQGIDLDKVDAGARILVKRYPYSTWVLNLAGWSACVQRDRSAARDMFGWIGSSSETAIWTSEEKFQRARSWAMSDRRASEQTSCNLASFGVLTCVAYSPDGKTIAVGGVERLQQVSLWDAATAKRKAILPHPDRVLAIEFSPDGHSLATAGGNDGKPQLMIWDLTDENELEPRD